MFKNDLIHRTEITEKSICRLCLESAQSDSFINIFTSFNCDQEIALFLIKFAEIEIEKGDFYPKSICTNCLERLKDVYDFKLLIRASDTRLKTEFLAVQKKVGREALKVEESQVVEAVPKTAEIDLDKVKEEPVEDEDSVNPTDFLKTEIQTPNNNSNTEYIVDTESETAVKLNKSQSQNEVKTEKSVVGKKIRRCTICKESFKSFYKLTRHMAVHTGKFPFYCDVCKKGFVDKRSLSDHKMVHTGEKPCQCDRCGKSFRTLAQLYIHKKTHEEFPRPKPFKCDLCEKSFRQRSLLAAHRRKHTGEKSVICEFCSKAFHDNADLYYHRKHTHMQTQRLPCPICKNTFANKNSLRTHIKRHSGEIRAYCKVCNRGFKNEQSVKKHMVIHTGEKPYTCEICHKSFSFEATLFTHRRVHTGETKFECKECGRKFKYGQQYRTHVQKAHPDTNNKD